MRKVLTTLCCLLALTATAGDKWVGGDISLLTSYIDHGAHYYQADGTPIGSPLQFFADQGMNAMRVRLFVDPANASSADKEQGVVQDLAYAKRLGKMIKDAGMALMLDFHYSDSWADPAKQWTPKSWEGLSDADLYDTIYKYTKEVLQAMKDAGAAPDMIQTGNEISYGMLWGRSTDSAGQLKKCHANSDANWTRFTTLLKRAIAACREVLPEAKVIIHTERVAQPNILKAYYEKMASYGVDYDIIGLSYYSYYHGSLSALNTALTQLESSFPQKKIMLVEVGYYHDWQPSNVSYDLSSTYPINGEGQKKFTEALIDIANRHTNVNGLFWWFMEANECGLDWNTQRVTKDWYNAGLFDNQTGRAEPAIYVLKNFVGGSDGIRDIQGTPRFKSIIHTLDGRPVGTSSPLPKGIYIVDGKKVAF